MKGVPPRRVELRCRCGEMLSPMFGSGEFWVIADRECPCGARWHIELQRAGYDRDCPRYAVVRLEVR